MYRYRLESIGHSINFTYKKLIIKIQLFIFIKKNNFNQYLIKINNKLSLKKSNFN